MKREKRERTREQREKETREGESLGKREELLSVILLVLELFVIRTSRARVTLQVTLSESPQFQAECAGRSEAAAA